MTERPSDPAHRRFEDMAVTHVLGGLVAEDSRQFRAHLLDCPSCRARVGELRAIAHDLADVERDERRTAERRQVETKPVDTEVEIDAEAPRETSRRWMVGAATALFVLIALVGWNFLLRSRVQEDTDRIAQLQDAVITMEFGTSWAVTYPGPGSSVRGAVSESAGDLTILLDGGEPAPHRLFLFDEAGNRVSHTAIQLPAARSWVYTVEDVSDRAVRLEVTRSEVATDGPTGPVVLEAARPAGP